MAADNTYLLAHLLAQILQGESNTEIGQLAVLNVLQNRAAQNYGGYGRDIMSQALARANSRTS